MEYKRHALKRNTTQLSAFGLALLMGLNPCVTAFALDSTDNIVGKEGAYQIQVTADVASSWTVSIPKNISLTSASKGTGTYTGSVPVTVEGDIATNEVIVVDSDDSFVMRAGANTTYANVSKQKTEFSFDDLTGGAVASASHLVSAELTPATWEGTLKFYINLEKDGSGSAVVDNGAVIAYGNTSTIDRTEINLGGNIPVYKACDFNGDIEDLLGKRLMMSIISSDDSISVGVDLTEDTLEEAEALGGVYSLDVILVVTADNELGAEPGIYVPREIDSLEEMEFIIYDHTKNVDANENVMLYWDADSADELIHVPSFDTSFYKVSDKTFKVEDILGNKATILCNANDEGMKVGASIILSEDDIEEVTENVYMVASLFAMVTGDNALGVEKGIYLSSDAIELASYSEIFLTKTKNNEEDVILNYKMSRDGYTSTGVQYSELDLVKLSNKKLTPSQLNGAIVNIKAEASNENFKSYDKYLMIDSSTVELVQQNVYLCDIFLVVTGLNEMGLGVGVYAPEFFAGVNSELELTLYNNNNNIYYYEDGVLFDSENKEKLLYYSGASNSTSYTIPNSVKTIGYEAFSYADNITTVNFNDGLVEIEDNAFYDNTGITSIVLPSTLKTVGGSAFTNCSNVTTLILNGGLEYIGASAFNYMGDIGTLVIPGSVEYIGDWAFHCTEVRILIVEHGVKALPNNMMYNYGILEVAFLPTTIETIGESAFYYWKPNGDNTRGGVIHYAGTEEQWNSIEKDRYFDAPAVIEFNSVYSEK